MGWGEGGGGDRLENAVAYLTVQRSDSKQLQFSNSTPARGEILYVLPVFA